MRNYWNGALSPCVGPDVADYVTCNGWHGLVEHKPLGSTNRARRVVYAESRMLREKMNSVKPIIGAAERQGCRADLTEPRSLADFPVRRWLETGL